MFNPADIVTRGVAHHPPPMHAKQVVEVSAKIEPAKERKRKSVNLKKPGVLVGKPIVEIKERDTMPPVIKIEEIKKEEAKPAEKAKRVRKAKVNVAEKVEEMADMISELRKDAGEMKRAEGEKESKVKVPRKGRFEKGSQEAKDYMAAMRAKKGKKAQ